MLKEGCPFCGHLYVKWINYERWWRSSKRSKEYRRVYPLGA